MLAPTSRAFLKGIAFGGVAVFLLIWVFPEIAPVSGGGSGDDGSHDHLPTLERVKRTGVIRVGYANEAPYAYVDPGTGKLTGEAPEVARVVFGRMGIGRVEGVLTEFGSLIPALKAGRFDVIAAGMYITPKRCEQVGFSNPSYRASEGLIVRAGNPKDLHSYADIASTRGATVGVVTGAIQRRYALDSGVPSDRIVVFPDAPTAVEGVAAGRVDAYGATSLTVNDLLAKADDPGLARATPFEDPVVDGAPVRAFGAFAFRIQDEALRLEFDRELAAFVGTDEHAELVAPFGFTPAELPGEVTAAELCRP